MTNIWYAFLFSRHYHRFQLLLLLPPSPSHYHNLFIFRFQPSLSWFLFLSLPTHPSRSCIPSLNSRRNILLIHLIIVDNRFTFSCLDNQPPSETQRYGVNAVDKKLNWQLVGGLSFCISTSSFDEFRLVRVSPQRLLGISLNCRSTSFASS